MNKLRTLKIYHKIRIRTYDSTKVPKIRLEGKLLKELGFDIGKEIQIKRQKNKLIITLTDKEQ